MNISRCVWIGTVGLAILLVAAVSAGQQPRTVADGVYSPAQGDRGEAKFKASCSACHTPSSFGGGAFAERWNGQTMAEVFDFVSNAMPENDPGGLKKEEYADVLAFILRVNDYPAGDGDLPADSAQLKELAIAPAPK